MCPFRPFSPSPRPMTRSLSSAVSPYHVSNGSSLSQFASLLQFTPSVACRAPRGQPVLGQSLLCGRDGDSGDGRGSGFGSGCGDRFGNWRGGSTAAGCGSGAGRSCRDGGGGSGGSGGRCGCESRCGGWSGSRSRGRRRCVRRGSARREQGGGDKGSRSEHHHPPHSGPHTRHCSGCGRAYSGRGPPWMRSYTLWRASTNSGGVFRRKAWYTSPSFTWRPTDSRSRCSLPVPFR